MRVLNILLVLGQISKKFKLIYDNLCQSCKRFTFMDIYIYFHWNDQICLKQAALYM